MTAGASEREPEPVRVVFDGVLGGRERAQEIVLSILRQEDYLERLGPHSVGESDATDVEEDETERRESPVLVGRGVADWVTANGGRLFLWGYAFGGGFDRMVAGTEPPDGLDFVRTNSGATFELYVEDGLSWRRPVRLVRRWFGLRDGVSVNTGTSRSEAATQPARTPRSAGPRPPVRG